MIRYTIEDAKLKSIEILIVASLLVGAILINFVVINKLAFLNLYYVPVLLGAMLLGKRTGVLTAFASVLIIGFSAYLEPIRFTALIDGISYFPFDIVIWGSFLVLTGYTVGVLYEQSENRLMELHKAYEGIVEILAKFIDSTDAYTRGHSIRVAKYSERIATVMGLSPRDVENIRVGGLLHDIGKIEISAEVIEKAAQLSEEEKEELRQHSQIGASLVGSVGGLLQDVVPIIRAHHEYYSERNMALESNLDQILLGARIVAVADAYDAITTDRPYRAGKAPWQAIKEIEAEAGIQFDPNVVEAFKVAIREELEEAKQAV